MNPKQTLTKIKNLHEMLSKTIVINKSKSLTNTINGKEHRTYNQREAIEATGFHNRNITAACEELEISTNSGNNKWRISLADIQKLRELAGYAPLKRLATQKCIVKTISSLKGGAGKTTAAVNLATGLATEPKTKYRVALIDLDPQATATLYLKPNMSEEYFSVGDLLSGNFDLDDDESFQDLCRSSFCETNIPNLHILPARDADRNYEIEVKKREIEASKNGKNYLAYQDLQNIIDAVKDDYDIIIIDTPPAFSAPMLSAHYVADDIIIPLRVDENDLDASSKYMEFLEQVYEILIGLGHEGWDSIKVLLSGVKTTSVTQKKILHTTRAAIGDDCFVGQFSEREAVRACANNYCSVFDMSGSNYTEIKSDGKKLGSSKKTLISAQVEFNQVIEEIEEDMNRKWDIK